MILIVEDERDARAALVKLMRCAGFDAVGVSDGLEALQVLRTSLPRLIILDHRMPGMDGIEVLRRVRAEPRTAAVPVVFFTAEASGLLRADAMAAGAHEYVRKDATGWMKLMAWAESHAGPPSALDREKQH